MDAETFLDRCLRLDLETNEAGEIYALAARWNGRELQFSGHFTLADALTQLDQAASEVDLLLGHNLLHHDLDVLRGLAPRLKLLDMPVVDTLYLSPLAFPENPYHRLVKDYKLLRDARNDPLADVRLTEQLWQEQWQSFADTSRTSPVLLRLFADCFRRSEHAGLAAFFDALVKPEPAPTPLPQWLAETLTSRVCQQALQHDLIEPLQQALTDHRALPLHWAYAIAWLQVAGGNSVLPPWVRLRLPDCTALLQRLRDQPCNDPQCRYCQQHHDPVQQLQRWFGFPSFRAEPANADGGSLQHDIVSHAIGGQPLFAILPTGGGKSLCFQVPALARHLRLGLLTIVISPLQALMKDQVDNLCERTGGNLAGALYGLLSMPERGKLLDDIRLGDLALLYVSPEQLRNPGFQKAIAHREIAAWVFDEAHCLSKWGHDFRPDYLYAARFIKEFAATQKTPPPPVQCFTATAKRSVIEEIRAYFLEHLGQELRLFEGGVERDNLHFEVQPVTKAQKLPRLLQLLQDQDRLPANDGSAVIYCASRKGAEEAAQFLSNQGLSAAHFHAGMEAGNKRSVQESFVAGELRVICATNAFGMGIDKDNVRLVIHLEVPGSLENYLQEAGRAGRDRADAQCILLYDEQDIETQFSLGAQSKLSQRDINEILRSLRRLRRQSADGDTEVVLTSAELLRDDALNISFDNSDRQADTKVRSAIAWLERADLLQRNQNRTQVFQGRPLVRDLQQARDKIAHQNLSQRQQQRWLAIIEALLQADSDDGFSADELAQHGAFSKVSSDRQRETEAQRVMRTLHDMSQAGLIQKSTLLSALLRHKVSRTPQQQLQRICELEDALLALLREQAPDAADQQWQQLSLRHLNQHLLDQDLDSDSPTLRKLLFSLAHDGQGLAGDRGSLSLRQDGREQLQIRLHREWHSLQATAKRRQAVAGAVLKSIQAKIPKGSEASAQLLVEFALEDLLQGLQQDALLAAELKDPLAAAERGLLFLHEQKVIQLQKGLAVFRQAMTIRIPAEANRRRYTKGDYAPLHYHHIERVFQVHVINEYARLGLERITQALALVLAYFQHSKKDFVREFFAGRKEELEHALSEQAYKRITASLSPVQSAVVSSPAEQNLLVLAGPGSGKTRLVVHRCAWLLQVQRVPARGMLVLSFNRSAALELRRRLAELVGDSARGVTILTYHGLALRLTGRSLAAAAEHGDDAPDWDQCLQQATDLLNGEADTDSIDDRSGSTMRDELLSGYRHILVDEYQDIDARQYALVCALTGRSLKDKDARLSILAVGDDDQNIYAFRDTNVAFIHRFRDDYQAYTHLLTENYRSSACIIDCANQLIAANHDRMKTGDPIRIDQRRRDQPRGGDWQDRDALAQGRVQCLQMDTPDQQALATLAELQRLRQLQPSLKWGDCAVLARGWKQLQTLYALCRQQHIPVLLRAEQSKLPSRTRLREYTRLLQWLQHAPEQTYSVDTLQQQLVQLAGEQINNHWWRELHAHLEDWRIECGDTPQPPAAIRDALYETLADNQRQGRDGDHLLLSTAHSAKGMEFDHLLVLDGGWSPTDTRSSSEEERRLYYVAMTRARHTLSLFELSGSNNPHTQLLRQQLSIDTLLARRPPILQPTPPDSLSMRYEILGPAELYMDLAGRQPAEHSIHRQLAALNPGDPLQLVAHGNRLRLLADNGLPLAQLAADNKNSNTTTRWQARLTDIHSVRVVAMMQRRISDIKDPQYHAAMRVPHWELPLVEISWQEHPAPPPSSPYSR